MRILFIGDIVGKYGLEYLKVKLPQLRNDYKPNLIIVNAENTTNGKGLNFRDYKELMSLNISALTMGNHTYRNQEINDFIENATLKESYNEAISQNDNLKSRNNKLKKDNAKLKKENKKLNKFKKEVLSSSSWKITKPLRKITKMLKGK